MSMHQMEYFIEEAVRATAKSTLSTHMKRNIILTLFEMETYGDCGFTNLRTIDEMVACKYTTLFHAEEMYDYKEHPEYYADDHYYTGPDGVYYDAEQKKYCVDSGSKAWEIMVQKGLITGEAAEPVEMMPFIKVFKIVKNVIGEMDSYLADGFHCTLFLTEAFDEMTDEESIEMLGMSKEEFEDFIENDDSDEEQKIEPTSQKTKTYDFFGTQVSFAPDYGINDELNVVMKGFKSVDGLNIDIFKCNLPLSVEIRPFSSNTIIDVFEVMKDMSIDDYGKAVEHIKANCANHPAFDVLVKNILIYLQPIKDDPGFISNSILSYKNYNRITENVNVKPVGIHAISKIEGLSVITEIFVKMLAENKFSYDIHAEYKYEIVNEVNYEKELFREMKNIKNLKKEKYYYEGMIDSVLFHGDIGVSIDVNFPFPKYINACINLLNDLGDEMIDKLCEYSILYCEDFCDAVGEVAPKFESKRDILKHLHSANLVIETPKDDSVVIRLSFECDWEEEHGMEWLIKDDKILYVGANANETAYADESYYNNSWNYANLKK